MDQLKDNFRNKVYLCVNYPFSNYDHVYYDNTGDETAFSDATNIQYTAAQANLKKNIYSFVKSYTTENNSIDDLSAIDLTRGVVKLPIAYKQGINYNYMIICRYGNSSYNKNYNYFYAFIDDVEWSSNLESATIHFHIDSWNTYLPRLNFKQSYIEREHVSDDAVGKHILDEGLSPSNYKVINSSRENFGSMVPLIAVGSNTNIYREGPNQQNPAPARVLNPSDNYGYNPLLLGPAEGSTNPTGDIAKIVDALTRAGQADGILGAYLMPDSRVAVSEDIYIITGKDADNNILRPPISDPRDYEVVKAYTALQDSGTPKSVSRPTGVTGVTIRNNKTLNYPYCFVNISNQMGNELTLKFENSNTPTSVSVKIVEDNNVNGALYLHAVNYDGVATNLDYSLQSINYPTLPMVIDSYDSYIASNKNTIANSKNYIDNDYKFNLKQGALEADATQTLSQINNLMSVAGGTAAGGGAAAGPSGIIKAFTDLYAQGTAAQLKINSYDYARKKTSDSIAASLADKANMPDKYCGRYIPNLLLVNDEPGFIFKTMCALPEELQAVDDYFSRYGYKVNTFDTPDFFNRVKFDYKKIIDINFDGECPNNHINIIKSMFNNGVTLWHHKAYIYLYNTTNGIHSH